MLILTTSDEDVNPDDANGRVVSLPGSAYSE